MKFKIIKKDYKKIFISAIVLLIIVVSIIIFIKNDNELINDNLILSDDIGNNEDNNKIDFINNVDEISDRYTYFKDDSNIFIGTNKNEIENGYYDLAITISENTVYIYINKLFKEYDEKSLYSEDYITEILIYFNNLVNTNFDFFYIKEDIQTYYLEVKDIHNEKEVNYTKIINDFNIDYNEEDNMLVITIKE